MTKWVHDLGLGLGPIPTREVSREELEKMYPPAKAKEIHERILDFIALWFGIGTVEELSLEECKRRWPGAEQHVEAKDSEAS